MTKGWTIFFVMVPFLWCAGCVVESTDSDENWFVSVEVQDGFGALDDVEVELDCSPEFIESDLTGFQGRVQFSGLFSISNNCVISLPDFGDAVLVGDVCRRFSFDDANACLEVDLLFEL